MAYDSSDANSGGFIDNIDTSLFPDPEAGQQGSDFSDSHFDTGARPRYNKVCPSVLKGEPCWALSRGKPCHYAKHERDGVPRPANLPISSNVYVCHLPPYMNKDQLQSMFAPYGTIRECKLLVEPRTQEPKGVGFVHFLTPQEAKDAIEALHGMLLQASDKPLECRLARPSVKGPSERRGPPRGPRRDERQRDPRDRHYDDRGYDYRRSYDDYEYGPVRRGPPGLRPSPYGRSEPRRSRDFEYDSRGDGPRRGDYDSYPPRGRDPPLEGDYYLGGSSDGRADSSTGSSHGYRA